MHLLQVTLGVFAATIVPAEALRCYFNIEQEGLSFCYWKWLPSYYDAKIGAKDDYGKTYTVNPDSAAKLCDWRSLTNPPNVKTEINIRDCCEKRSRMAKEGPSVSIFEDPKDARLSLWCQNPDGNKSPLSERLMKELNEDKLKTSFNRWGG